MEYTGNKEQAFVEMLDKYKGVIAKVCCVYISPRADFDDLYQETVANLWQGFDKFRGDSKPSTWIYRVAINTCITWARTNRKYSDNIRLENDLPVYVEDGSRLEEYRRLQGLIMKLDPLEKAIVTLWLDENSYDDIASITGLSRSNVAVKFHRIKAKMAKMSAD